MTKSTEFEMFAARYNLRQRGRKPSRESVEFPPTEIL